MGSESVVKDVFRTLLGDAGTSAKGGVKTPSLLPFGGKNDRKEKQVSTATHLPEHLGGLRFCTLMYLN